MNERISATALYVFLGRYGILTIVTAAGVVLVGQNSDWNTLVFLSLVCTLYLLVTTSAKDSVRLESALDERLVDPRSINSLVQWMVITEKAMLAHLTETEPIAVPADVWIGVGDYNPSTDETTIIWKDMELTVPGKIERPPYETEQGKNMREQAESVTRLFGQYGY